MSTRRVLAGLGVLALVSVAACGSSGESSGAAPVTMASWYNTVGLPEINTVNQDIETVSNDGNYGIDPMSDEEQVATDAEAGLADLPPVDAADWIGWLKNVILTEQIAEQNPYLTPQEEQAITVAGQYAQAFAAAVATATGSGSPSAPADTQPPATAPTPAPTVTVTQPATTDPWAVISEYYDLIESGQYQTAWDMGSQSFMDQNGDNFQAWENGYANTGTQTLTEISESGETVYVNLSAVDTATGEIQYFTGWYTVDSSTGLITAGSMSQTG